MRMSMEKAWAQEMPPLGRLEVTQPPAPKAVRKAAQSAAELI
jgi:hypothetical protein